MGSLASSLLPAGLLTASSRAGLLPASFSSSTYSTGWGSIGHGLGVGGGRVGVRKLHAACPLAKHSSKEIQQDATQWGSA